jgi:hypothetical protein
MQMNKRNVSKLASLFLLTVLVVVMALNVTGCGAAPAAQTVETATQVLESGEIGEGSKQFYLTVTDGDGNQYDYTVNTDAETVGDALLELGLIAGDETEYGLYVKEVNGFVADYDTDGTYWAFYIDGEYAMTGVDQTEITEGSTYTLQVEK